MQWELEDEGVMRMYTLSWSSEEYLYRWTKQWETDPARRRSQHVNRAWADRLSPNNESEDISIIGDLALEYVRNQPPCYFGIPLRWYSFYGSSG